MAAAAVKGMTVSEQKKRWIVESLNPVLEECVADTIAEAPEDPVNFMRAWMMKRSVQNEDEMLHSSERERLEKENASLETEIITYQYALKNCAACILNQPKAPDDSEEDVDDVEEPPDFEQTMPMKSRASVSAEAYGAWNTKKAFVPPMIAKTPAQKTRLKKVLSNSILFANLESNDFSVIIAAMKELQVEEEDAVITQGDLGDSLFVIESGEFECSVKGSDGVERVLKTCGTGDVFGELALLYNAPRAATVKCKAFGVCWQLDRETFNSIVRDAAQKKRDRYVAFLSKVSIFSGMDAYELSQVADAIRAEEVAAGTTIMNQGQVGDKFYIIEEGSAYAVKDGAKVMDYSVGDYFGELALIADQPRAASVVAKTSTVCLSVEKNTFQRVIKVSELMERTSKYV